MRHCLLCDQQLQPLRSYTTLIIKTIAPSICMSCEQTFERSITRQALYTYNAAMQDWLHRYKIQGDVQLANVFSSELATTLKNERAIIVPIPLHDAKFTLRTFAQVDELLRCANIPFVHHLKKVHDVTQGERTRAERLASDNPFVVTGDVTAKEIVIFDDIITTGTTLQQASDVLVRAGAASVKVFALSASEIS